MLALIHVKNDVENLSTYFMLKQLPNIEYPHNLSFLAIYFLSDSCAGDVLL